MPARPCWVNEPGPPIASPFADDIALVADHVLAAVHRAASALAALPVRGDEPRLLRDARLLAAQLRRPAETRNIPAMTELERSLWSSLANLARSRRRTARRLVRTFETPKGNHS
jgi:hypothetical protein